MKKLPLLFAAFLVVSASGLRAGEPSDIHTLLRRLDGLLDRREEFLLRHEARLDSLKSLLCGDTLGFGARYAVTAEIAERYFAYQSDSTIAYLRRNVALAERAGNADLTIRAKSVMAMCYSMNGRFLEADRVLAGATDTLHMSRATQAAYYAAQHRQNRECRSQSEPGAERDRFRACEEYYARRALETTGDISKRFYFAYLVAVDEGDYDRAAAACDSALACAPPASHDYARAAFYRSETERFRGDEAARFEWLVRAAMADVQGAVRDYGALGGVAEELLRRGDAARAMRCIRVAINDTQAYNSPIRSWRDMAILPQIEQAYSERNARLRAMYVALILLAFLFALSAIGGVLFVLRQNRRLNAVQQTLRESNGKLAELAASLRETNADLSRQNIRIADANRIKEVYIGGFLKTISEYIYKLADTYRHVGRMLRDGRSDELRREYAGTDVRSDELKEFYHNFDTTFLGPLVHRGVQPSARRRCAHRGPSSGKPHDRTAHLRAGPAGHHRHGDHRRTAALFGQYGVQLPFAHAVAFARSGAGFRTAGAVHRSRGRCRGAFRDLIGTGPLVGETRSFFARGVRSDAEMRIFAARIYRYDERFCSHRFRNGQRQAHERLLGGRRRRARRRGGRYVLPPDPSPSQFLQPFHDGHPRSAL